MSQAFYKRKNLVHYRIGSLEMKSSTQLINRNVHYRIGSLEMKSSTQLINRNVHYRIGSLETDILESV